MVNKFLILALAFFVLTLPSCKKSNFFAGVGEKATEKRETGTFDKVAAFDDVNVFIKQDTFFSVEAEAGKNLLKYVTAEVVNGELQLRNENTMKWWHSYKKSVINFYVTMPEINSIINYGTGQMKSLNTLSSTYLVMDVKSAGDISMDLNCGTVWGHMSSSGDVTLSGKTQANVWYCIGYGMLDCRNLIAGYAWDYNGSTCDAYLHVTGLLIGYIENLGNIYYTGNPSAVDVKGSGKGKPIPF